MNPSSVRPGANSTKCSPTLAFDVVTVLSRMYSISARRTTKRSISVSPKISSPRATPSRRSLPNQKRSTSRRSTSTTLTGLRRRLKKFDRTYSLLLARPPSGRSLDVLTSVLEEALFSSQALLRELNSLPPTILRVYYANGLSALLELRTSLNALESLADEICYTTRRKSGLTQR